VRTHGKPDRHGKGRRCYRVASAFGKLELRRGLRRKWLWFIFILFGIGQLSVDWNSGAWEFSPLHFLLFSASAVSPGYGPWVVSTALPLGAAWYLARRFLNHRAAERSNVA
jgi:hypothetical protein